MTIEQRIIKVAEKQNYYDSRELRAIALEVRKMEDRIKQLERELNEANAKIKRLVEAGDEIVDAGWSVQDWSGMCVVWAKAKEAKL